jgi:hypothetical protein
MFDAREIHRATVTDGGSSTDLLGHVPTVGYMVSVYASKGLILPVSQFTPELVTEYAANHQEILAREDHYLGTWIDSGRVYLDIALRVDRLEEALELGRRHRQLAVFDLETFETVEVI